VVAKLEFTGIWVALIFPIFVLCVAVSGKFTVVVKVLGFSLNLPSSVQEFLILKVKKIKQDMISIWDLGPKQL
jgi:hypothetical protein